MSMSGITIPENIIKIYENKRMEKKPGGLVLKIVDESLEIDNNVDGDYELMVKDLPESEPRYVLYDIPMKNRANLDDVKSVFIFWMPMSSSVRLRMQYASTKSTITKTFRGIAMVMQPDEKEEIVLNKVINKLRRHMGINNP